MVVIGLKSLEGEGLGELPSKVGPSAPSFHLKILFESSSKPNSGQTAHFIEKSPVHNPVLMSPIDFKVPYGSAIRKCQGYKV